MVICRKLKYLTCVSSLSVTSVFFPQVQILLKLWRNGFSLDDGELRSYSDPINAQFLESVKRGWVKIAILLRHILQVKWRKLFSLKDWNYQKLKVSAMFAPIKWVSYLSSDAEYLKIWNVLVPYSYRLLVLCILLVISRLIFFLHFSFHVICYFEMKPICKTIGHLWLLK